MSTETLFELTIKFIFSYVLGPLILIAACIFELLTTNRAEWIRPSPTTISADEHARKVRDVRNQVIAWNAGGRKGQMCSGRPTWKSISVHNINKDRFTRIELDLNDIIQIDTENKVVTVEPGISMGRLTSILVPKGWTIPVVPELELLTIGGCVCGAGLETSSHKYGLLADSCISYEFVLANGELISCSETENADLFHCIPMSHGSLGFLTAVTFPLIPAGKYVKLEYWPMNLIETDLQKTGFEFIEGIVFSKKKAVVMYGNMVDKAEPEKVNYINRWYKPWFYKHVEAICLNSSSEENPIVEYIPLRDYYHRHTRSYFWETPLIIPYGNNPLFRYLFGWVYPLNYQLLKRFATAFLWDLFCVKNHVLQDFVVPIAKVQETLAFSDKLVQVYPIWLCPCVYLNKPGRGKPVGAPDEMLVDVGIYGLTQKTQDFDPETTTRKMEKFIIENKGFQGTYADTYMTREEFTQMFDVMTDYYRAIRVKYGCVDAFPDVYDKISREARKRGHGHENGGGKNNNEAKSKST